MRIIRAHKSTFISFWFEMLFWIVSILRLSHCLLFLRQVYWWIICHPDKEGIADSLVFLYKTYLWLCTLMLPACYCFLSIALQFKQFCFFRNDRFNTPHAKAFNLVFICLFIFVLFLYILHRWFTGERCLEISFGFKVKLFYDHWSLVGKAAHESELWE